MKLAYETSNKALLRGDAAVTIRPMTREDIPAVRTYDRELMATMILLAEAEKVARAARLPALDIGTNTCSGEYTSLRRFGLRVFYEYDDVPNKSELYVPPAALASSKIMTEILAECAALAGEIGAEQIPLPCPCDVDLGAGLDVIERQFAFAWLRKRV